MLNVLFSTQAANDGRAALAVFRAALAAGVGLDARAYASAISACKRLGDWEAALGLLDEARGKKVAIDVVAVTAAMAACEAAGAWRPAARLFDELAASKLRPDARCCNTALAARGVREPPVRFPFFFRLCGGSYLGQCGA